MSKINFSKVEGALDQALKKLFIDRLSELALIENAIRDDNLSASSDEIKNIVDRFQSEFKKLKDHDKKLYLKLNLTEEEELRLFRSFDEFTQADWVFFKKIKEKIELFKKELDGHSDQSKEDEKVISTERRRHIHKRHNIRDGWLPLK